MAFYCADLPAITAGAEKTILVEVGEAGEALQALTITPLDSSAALIPLHQVRVSVAGVGPSGGTTTTQWPTQVSGSATTASAAAVCGDGAQASWLTRQLSGIRATASSKITVKISVVTNGTAIADGVIGLVTGAA